VANEPYTLGPGDRLQLALFQLPQYSGEFEVQIDGTLTLPQVGNISVQSLTLEAASAAISARYGQFLRRPGVTLNLVTRRPLVVAVAGEINRPGAYTLPIQNTAFPTLTQLLTQAGGITRSANLREVQVQRLRNGQRQVFSVNLWDLVSSGNLGQDIPLRDGDSIFIPSTLVPLEEAQLLAEAGIAPISNTPINVAVIGEVFRPGPYTLQGGVTRTGDAGLPGGESGNAVRGNAQKVTDAIQIAGGIKPLANIRQVQVRRLTRTGGEQLFTVDLWSLLQVGATQQNALLQDGDTVVIPTVTVDPDALEASNLAESSFAPNSIRINVVGEVGRPGLIEVPPNTPLNQGLLAAGGFNQRARKASVGLVRLNPDGTVIQREIPIDFAQGISEENNPTLLNNDIIIVGESGLATFSYTLGAIAGPIADFLFILGAPFRAIDYFN
jgi:polysaccharide export outer membrane protein